MNEFCKILPCAAAAASPNPVDKGWRLRVTCDDGYSLELVEEQVLPERVTSPDARRVLARLGEVKLTPDEAKWLRDVIDEYLDSLPEARK